MDAYLNEAVRYLVAQSWQIALLTMAVAVVAFALRRRSAHARYLLWLIVLAKCLVPPLYMVPVRVLPETVRERVPSVLSGAGWTGEHVTFSNPVPIGALSPEPPKSSLSPPVPQTSGPRLSVSGWLGVLWIAGAGGYLLMNLLRALRGRHWLRRTRRPLSDDVQADTANLLLAYGIQRLPRIWLMEGVGQPFVWGLVRGSIYVPPGFFTIDSPDHRRDILAHELSHVLRFDAAVNTLQVIAQGLFWFHPLVWWGNRNIRQEREKACDEMAVACLHAKPKEYSIALVNTLIQAQESTRSVPSLAVAGPVKNIEERIKTMMTPGRKFHTRPSLAAVTAAILLALLIVPTALVLTARAQTEAAAETQAKPAMSLHDAIKGGDLAAVKRLIAQGADVTDTHGNTTLTPLGEAAHKGRAEIVKVLLENGADVDVAADHFTPLYYAIWSGDQATVKALIAAGANVNVLPDEKDFPPLIYAIWEKNAGIVAILLDAGADLSAKTGADLNVRNKDGFTPLYWAAVSGSREVFDRILARGKYADTIHLAACKGDLEKVKTLVEEGMDVNARDECGCTPLHWAAYGDLPAVADYLIAKGADIDAKDNLGRAPLMWAGGLSMVKLFIAKGADLHTRAEQTGQTKLQEVCIQGDKDVVDFLLSQGEDIDQRDESGSTPLVLAAAFGHVDVVEFLIAKGADVNVTGPDGRTIVDVARQREHTEVVTVLRQRGVKETLYGAAVSGAVDDARRLISQGEDVNLRNSMGGTPLHLAAQRGREPHRAVAELLIRAGADVNAKDNSGKTPLALAREGNRTEVIALLREHGAKE